MGWVITPNTGLATIDSNGYATFSEHSTDTVYTVSYEGSSGNCSTITPKEVTVYACYTPPTVTYTYTVYSDQNGASVRWSNGTTGTISSGSHTMTSTSSAGFSATLSKSGCSFPNNGATCSANSHVTINGSCGSSTYYYYVNVGSAGNGATVIFTDNGSPHTRTANSSGLATYSNTVSRTISVSISKTNCTFSPSTGTVTAGNIFYSTATCSAPASCGSCSDLNIHNLTTVGEVGNGINVTIAHFNTDCDTTSMTAYVINGNIDMSNLVIVGRASGSYDVVAGRINPNTTTGKLTAQIGIYAPNESNTCSLFDVYQSAATPSCNCNSVNMTITSVTFDASGGTKTIGSITSGCTLNPLSTFNWGKLYQDGTSIKVSADTNSSTTGRGTGITYNVIGSTVNSCGTITIGQKGQVPESWSINLRIANNDSIYHCIENVEIFLNTYGSIQTAQGECVNAGGEENLGTISFDNTASAPEGATITRIEAVVNNGSGAGTIKTLTTNNSILRNGNSYLFTLPAS